MKQRTPLAGNLILLAITLLLLYASGEVFSHYYFSRTDATNKELKIYNQSDLLAWELKPGATAYHGPNGPPEGKPPKIQINSFGMRNAETTLEKAKNTVRIAVLGDSFAFGMITDQEKIFPALLEKKINEELSKKTKKNYEVLNFGTIGYTVDQYYLQLREKILKFSPDITVVTFFAGNDATELRAHEWILDKENKLERIHDIYHIVTDDSQLRRKRAARFLGTPFITLLTEKTKIFLAKIGLPVSQPRLLWSNFLEPNHQWGDTQIMEYFEKAKQMLLEIKKLNDEKGIKTLIAIIPADVQVNPKYLLKYPGAPLTSKEYNDPNLGTRPQKIITEFGKENGIEVLDLLPVFKPVSGDLYFPENDPHFTPAGHQKTAEALFQKLFESGWL